MGPTPGTGRVPGRGRRPGTDDLQAEGTAN